MHILKYSSPARAWKQALPLGNGHMGVMAYGSLKKERLCFNYGTLWSGYPKNYDSKNSLKYLGEVRRLIFEGKNDEADKLCERELTGFYSESFLPLGDAVISFGGTTDDIFERRLDLSTALHSVLSGGARSELFVSEPDGIAVYRVTADSSFSARLTLTSPIRHRVSSKNGFACLYGCAPDYVSPNYLRGSFFPITYKDKKGMGFCLGMRVLTDGAVRSAGGGLKIKNARTLTVYFACKTGFSGFKNMPSRSTRELCLSCEQKLLCVTDDYETLKSRHIKAHSRLYGSAGVSFDTGESKEAFTDSLISLVKRGGDERALSELLYNFGRYLIISGSRPGGEALNLQGIWNHSMRPPWSSNYTVNINTQMNYWGASRAGLCECVEPLERLVYEVMQNGRQTAEINYGCRGFACNHNVDIWRKTPPVCGDANYMFEPLCGAWLANEVYQHFKNGALADKEEQVREIVTQCARFCADYLVEKDGYFVVCPSASPENVFSRGGKRCKLDYASSFDMALVRRAFLNALEISRDKELLSDIKEIYPRLYPFKNGSNGILEWHDDFETPEKGHRHFSPLYAFYPAGLIGYYSDPEKTRWVKRLFEYRLKNSGRHIGWSAAWAICLAARLREPETVRTVITGLLCHAVFSNLFCVHPPAYFQIDGNLGFVAGINEMLLTEEDGVIYLLPGLPENYAQSGSASGMLVNGARLSFEWKNGSVTKISADAPVRVCCSNVCGGAELDGDIALVPQSAAEGE